LCNDVLFLPIICGNNVQGKLTKEEDIFQEKSSIKVFWDYVKVAGGCSSAMIVAIFILLYSFGMAFVNYWVSVWLEANFSVRKLH